MKWHEMTDSLLQMFGDTAQETNCRNICYSSPDAIQKHSVALGLLHQIPLLFLCETIQHQFLALFEAALDFGGDVSKLIQIAFPLDVHTWYTWTSNSRVSKCPFVKNRATVSRKSDPAWYFTQLRKERRSSNRKQSWEMNHDDLILLQ